MDTLTKSWQEYEAAHALDGNRPTKDTGFRMKPQPPFSYTRVDRAIPRKRIWDFDHFHNDDLKDDGRALNAVRFVVPDCDAAAARNQKYLLESIGLTPVV